jgi:hypothetical protein
MTERFECVSGAGRVIASRRSAVVAALLLSAACASAANHAPVVSNVRAEARADGSGLVDIRFDATDADGDRLTVTVDLATNGAPLVVTNFVGHVGTDVVPGVNRHVVWEAPEDFCSPEVVASVTVDDGQTNTPPAGIGIPAGTNRVSDGDFGPYSLVVDTFWMDASEVTLAQWKTVHAWAVARGYGFDHAGSGKAAEHPVHTVNWYDCVKWCNARSEMEGRSPCYTAGGSVYRAGRRVPECDTAAGGYRLPTSVEWEYAARGGVSGTLFPGGATIGHDQANYYSSAAYAYDTSATRGYHPDYASGGMPYTSPAGTFAENGFGLYDMAGNVREWCWSLTATGNRDIRGGGWNRDARFLRCGYGNGGRPDDESNSLGFRSVASAARQVTNALSAAFIVCRSPLARALETANLMWSGEGWEVQTEVAHDGEDAAQASGDESSSPQVLETRVDGFGVVSFWYRVSEDSKYGDFVFSVDRSVNKLDVPADGGWREAKFSVPGSGEHGFKWENKGPPVWLDQVTWQPGAASDGVAPADGPVAGYGDGDYGFVPGIDAGDWPPGTAGGKAYLSPPDGAPLETPGQYDGWLRTRGEAPDIRGTLSVRISKVTGTLTAKALLRDGSVSFPSARQWTSAASRGRGVTLTAKSGERLTLYVNQSRIWGGLAGGKAGGDTLLLDGARNRFAETRDAAAQAELAGVKGLYTVALVKSVPDVVSRLSDVLPSGYLTLNVGNLGAVKLAGRLSDGTAVSLSAGLSKVDGDGLAFPVFKALYAKKGSVGALLWLNPEDKVIRVDAAYGWCVDWVCEDPKKGTFEKELEVVGGAFVGQDFEIPSYFGASVPSDLSAPVTGLDGEWNEIAFPWELPVTVNGTKWALPKATPPKKDGTGYRYDGGANPSAATLSYTAKTGLFKGTFKLYYDGFDARGALRHKTVSVSYTGVVTPVRDEAFAEWPVGLGIGAATVNKQKVAIPVFLAE